MVRLFVRTIVWSQSRAKVDHTLANQTFCPHQQWTVQSHGNRCFLFHEDRTKVLAWIYELENPSTLVRHCFSISHKRWIVFLSLHRSKDFGEHVSIHIHIYIYIYIWRTRKLIAYSFFLCVCAGGVVIKSHACLHQLFHPHQGEFAMSLSVPDAFLSEAFTYLLYLFHQFLYFILS